MIKGKRLLKSFSYALRGLLKTIKEEQNLKIQFIISFIVIILSIFFKVSLIEWCILIISMLIVIITEIINSALERVADIIKPRIHDYVKEIKDIMAAAVMLSAISSIIIGILIFFPYIWHFLFYSV